MKTKKSLLTGCVLCVMMLAGASAAEPENEATPVVVKQVELQLPDGWERVAADGKSPVVMRCMRDGKLIGMVSAARLAKTVREESEEFVASANEEPTVFMVLDNGTFETDSGLSGQRVLLGVRAKDERLGAPLAMHSIYLPLDDGRSIVFMLRCAVPNLKWLWLEFEGMMKSAVPINDR